MRNCHAFDGALVGLAQLALGELVATLNPDATSPIDDIGQVLIDLTPGPAVDVIVATAESADKLLLRAGLMGGWIVVAAGAHRRGNGKQVGAALSLGGAAAAWVREDGRRVTNLGVAAVGAAAAVASRELLRRRPGRAPRAAIVVSASGALAATVMRRRARDDRLDAFRAELRLPPASRPEPPLPTDASFAIDGLTPLSTPPDRFYVTDVHFPAPRVRPSAWRLRITGMVDAPYELTLDELLAFELVEIDATLVCVHNPVGGPRIGSARWLGVPVDDLLRRAQLHANADQLVARSVDGFTAGVPIDRVAAPHQAIVAVGMNGRPLPIANGFPARLLVPGLWGADANTKWLTELQATTWSAVSDYWDRRGWPRQPSIVRPGSRIDVPQDHAVLQTGRISLAGIAWAPASGVLGVDVAVDDGEWVPADLSPAVAPTLWRQWRLTWDAPPGDHVVRVRTRATDRTQREHVEPPYPVGSSGLHTIQLRVLSRLPTARDVATARGLAMAADVGGRVELAVTGLRAWTDRGYPPVPTWPAPAAGPEG